MFILYTCFFHNIIERSIEFMTIVHYEMFCTLRYNIKTLRIQTNSGPCTTLPIFLSFAVGDELWVSHF